MDQIKYELNELLRYGFGGGIFLATYVLLSIPAYEVNTFNPSGSQVSLLIAVSMVIGILIYTVHRALIYPIALRIIHRFLPQDSNRSNTRGHTFKITDFEGELNIARWKRRADSKSGQSRLDTWGSQSHFLYCAAEAILAAMVIAWIHGECQGPISFLVAGFVFGVIAFAAAVHDKRCIEMDIKLHHDTLDRDKSSTCPE